LRQEYSVRAKTEIRCAANGLSSLPTARANDAEKRGDIAIDPRNGLVSAAQQWLAPNVPNGGRSIAHATLTGRTAMHKGKKVQIGLEAQAINWAAHCARITKGGGNAAVRRDGKSRLDMLDWQAEAWNLEPSPAPLIAGGSTCSTDIPNSNQPSQKRRLNPIFVEALMRWPTGLSGFDTAATALTPWLWLMRGTVSTMLNGLQQKQAGLFDDAA
jgi:hypothetical protein